MVTNLVRNFSLELCKLDTSYKRLPWYVYTNQYVSLFELVNAKAKENLGITRTKQGGSARQSTSASTATYSLFASKPYQKREKTVYDLSKINIV